MKRGFFTIVLEDADIWIKNGLTPADEDAVVLALWRWKRGRSDDSTLSIPAKLVYAPIVQRWAYNESISEMRSAVGKKGAEVRWKGFANGKGNGKVMPKSKCPTSSSSSVSKFTKERVYTGGTPTIPPTHSKFDWYSQGDISSLNSEGIPTPFITKYAKDWKDAGGKAGAKTVTKANFCDTIRKWWECERNKDKYIQEFSPVVVKKRASTPDEWAKGLCAERCNNFDGTKCRVGYTRRPEDGPDRPRPPEECPHYVAKGDDQ